MNGLPHAALSVLVFLGACEIPKDMTHASSLSSADLSKRLGVPVEPIAGEVNQYLVKASRRSTDFSKVGKVHQDYGYAVGVTLPNGTQIGFRFAESSDSPGQDAISGPDPDDLGRILGVRVTRIRTQCRQYLVHAKKESIDFSRLGAIHSAGKYSVGVTLHDGMQVGFRYADPTGEELSSALGVPVEAIEDEPGQYYLYANAGTVDLSKLGKVHTDVGYAVGLTLKDGVQIGFRYVNAAERSRAVGARVQSQTKNSEKSRRASSCRVRSAPDMNAANPFDRTKLRHWTR
jgi:hypothetical protein